MAVRRPSVGILGAGVVAGAYASACRALGWPVDVVASRDHDRAAALASTVGADPATTTELLRAALDLVVVCTPPDTHLDIVQRSADTAGRLVLTGPLASTLADADRVVDASVGRSVAFAWPLVTAPVVQALVPRTDALGALTDLSSRSSRPRPVWGGYLDGSWGGGVLQFMGTEQVALTLLVARLVGLGEPVAVSGEMERQPNGIDVVADVALVFATGFAARIHADWTGTDSPMVDFQVAGMDGVLRFDLHPAATLEHDGVPVPLSATRHQGHQPLRDAGMIDMLAAIWTAFDGPGALAHGFSPSFGRDVLDVVTAAHASASVGGATIDLPYTGRRDRSLSRT